MFRGCKKLSKINIETIDLSEAVELEMMFEGCESLTEIIFCKRPSYTTVNLEYMFEGCAELKEANLEFLHGEVENIQRTFKDCEKLEIIDLCNAIIRHNVNMERAFCMCNHKVRVLTDSCCLLSSAHFQLIR